MRARLRNHEAKSPGKLASRVGKREIQAAIN
jgi:hypothetical protein